MRLTPFALTFSAAALLSACTVPVGNNDLAKGVPPTGAPVMHERAQLAAMPSPALMRAPSAPVERERYAEIEENGVMAVAESPVSTFSADVDSGAYAIVRSYLHEGRLPPSDAVRVEELINYFNYDYPAPSGDVPFSLVTEVGRTPWNPDTHLLHIGIQGKAVAAGERPPANLVFLIDVSGSMGMPNKLPLLKRAFKLLVKQLGPKDIVSMVVYAGASGVVLEPTPGSEGATIIAALEQLDAGGSTHGSEGIQLAYAMAEQGFVQGGINRVILATDGDFNVGVVDTAQLIDIIERQRAKGISLTTLGFGRGNYNDELMERLADKGNGNYAYIDSIAEARKVLVEELGATLETIAKDVKLQLEWNPAVVAEYRLIGYENRLLAREDFNNDQVDAGEIGAGHTVTALYEFSLVDGDAKRLEPLRYQSVASGGDYGDELAFLRLRYKAPDGDSSRLIEQPITQAALDTRSQGGLGSDNFRFSAAVAAFGQQLRGGEFLEGFGGEALLDLARDARGEDRHGYRGEFIRLLETAQSLD